MKVADLMSKTAVIVTTFRNEAVGELKYRRHFFMCHKNISTILV